MACLPEVSFTMRFDHSLRACRDTAGLLKHLTILHGEMSNNYNLTYF